MTVRNEKRYLRTTLQHLNNQGIDVCLIDNGSTDNTVEIAKDFLDKNVIRIEHFPYNGAFELEPILKNEERLAKEIEADWFIHHDADEIRQAPTPFKTLKEAFAEVDKQGYNAINFDEFVFLPTQENPNHETENFVETMKHYYFYEPEPIKRRINAWKNLNQEVNISQSGGHKINFEGRNIYPKPFILRHYIVLSYEHAVSKFCGRVYSEREVAENNWHQERAICKPQDITLPKNSQLTKLLDADKTEWNKKNAWKNHFFNKTTEYNNKKTFISKISKITSLLTDTEKKHIAETDKNLLPVPFVVGVGRSGSTLLRLMLDAHPQLAIPSETHFLKDIIPLAERTTTNKKKFFKTITNHVRWSEFHIDTKEFETNLNELKNFTFTEGLRIFYSLYAKKFQKQRWGDKTPPYDNLIQSIEKLLPEAHFIHIIRDGRDVALSYKDMWFGPDKNINSLANSWLYRIRETRRQAQNVKNYTEIKFEDLVIQPEIELKKICDFIKLPFDSKMLNYYQNSEERLSEMENRYNKDGSIRVSKQQRMDIFKLTNKPPDKSRIQAWKNKMPKEELIQFNKIAGDLLRDLGY